MKLAPKLRALRRIEYWNQARRDEFIRNAFSVDNLEGIVIGEIGKHPFKRGKLAIPISNGKRNYLLEVAYNKNIWTILFPRTRRYQPVNIYAHHYDNEDLDNLSPEVDYQ